MNYKIIATAIVIGALLIGTLSYFIWLKFAPETLIFLHPKEVNANVGENFTVFINISDVSDLYHWYISLQWNSTILELINVTEGSFLKSKGQTLFENKGSEGKTSINCTLTENISGVSGDGTLAEVEFKVKQHGTCTIQIYYSELLNSKEEKIKHSVSNCIVHAQPPQTSICLYPEEIDTTVGENFTVFINVSHVSDLYGWQVNLEWNSSMLELANITEGPFLKSKGQTFFSYTPDKNRVAIFCTLQGNVTGVSGEGTLAEVEFKVKQHGTCTIQIYKSYLVNSMEKEISHSVSNCRVHA